MAKDQGVNIPTSRNAKRPAAVAGKAPAVQTAAAKSRAAVAAAPKKRTSPAQFFREVRAEARKITWTPWKETWITSVMVFIMVALTAVFFFVVDSSLSLIVQQILKLAA